MTRVRPVLASLAAALVAAACSSPSDEPRNAVIITIDTMRADALGRPGVTPHLDQLARESVVYEQARTVAPLTMPAHASMFTGLYPPRHLVRDNNVQPVPSSAETTAERARAAGYETAAFVSSPAVDRAFGFDQGFDTYDQPVRPLVEWSSHYSDRSAADAAAAATRWLDERDRSKPFFLWLHVFDPHAPYEPSREFRSRAGNDPYLGEVAATDAAVGALLAGLRTGGYLDDTLVLVVADHGEALGDNGEATHGAYCYDQTMRVPFLIRYPDGHRAGERTVEPVSVTDVHPTLLDALDLGSHGDVDGVSLYRERVPPGRGVYFESYYGFISYGWSPLVGFADRQGVYVHAPQPLYFDPASLTGPGRAPRPDEASRMEAYRASIADIFARDPLPPSRELVDESMLEHLRSIGYSALASATADYPHPLKAQGLRDPHAGKEEHDRTIEAMTLGDGSQNAMAIPILEGLLRDNPRNVVALERLVNCLMAEARFADAIPHLRRLLDSGPAWAGAHYSLGVALMNTKQLDEALDHFRAAVVCDSGHVQSLMYLTLLLQSRGENEEASKYYALIEKAGAADQVQEYLEKLQAAKDG